MALPGGTSRRSDSSYQAVNALSAARLLNAMERFETSPVTSATGIDNRTLAKARYRRAILSTVDSGNLAGSLLVLAQGIDGARTPSGTSRKARWSAACHRLVSSSAVHRHLGVHVILYGLRG
jgi:hypothetical protein